MFPYRVSRVDQRLPRCERQAQAIGMAYGIAAIWERARAPWSAAFCTADAGLAVDLLAAGAACVGGVRRSRALHRRPRVARRHRAAPASTVTGLALITLGIALVHVRRLTARQSWGWLGAGHDHRVRRRDRRVGAVRRRREAGALAAGRPVAVPQPPGSRRLVVLRGTVANIAYAVDDLPVDGDLPAAGARPRSADGRSGVPRPVHRCGAGRPAVGPAGGQVSAGRSSWESAVWPPPCRWRRWRCRAAGSPT